jgi:hypothetical protein
MAVLVALAGYSINEWYRREDRRRADVSTAQLVGMKVFRVLNSSEDIRRHVWAPYDGPPLGTQGQMQIWRSIHPLTGVRFDDSLNLDGPETGLLIRLRETAFLVELMLATARLRSIIDAMNEFATRRDSYQEKLPIPRAVDGRTVTVELTPEDYLKQQPYSEQLEALITSIRELTIENVETCKGLAERFHPLMKRHYPRERFISFGPMPSDVGAT